MLIGMLGSTANVVADAGVEAADSAPPPSTATIWQAYAVRGARPVTRSEVDGATTVPTRSNGPPAADWNTRYWDASGTAAQDTEILVSVSAVAATVSGASGSRWTPPLITSANGCAELGTLNARTVIR